MKNILVLHSSVRTNDSISRALVEYVVNRLDGSANNTMVRDLSEGIPLLTEPFLKAIDKPFEKRSPEERELAELSDELIKDLQWSDHIVIGSPMYNFGPPASLKAWADLVARSGVTFHYTERGSQGLLKNKNAHIIAVTGGTRVNSNNDFMTPWVEHFLRFIGVKNISTIVVDEVYAENGEKKVQMARQAINDTIAVAKRKI